MIDRQDRAEGVGTIRIDPEVGLGGGGKRAGEEEGAVAARPERSKGRNSRLDFMFYSFLSSPN
jgi:hypothetical protein